MILHYCSTKTEIRIVYQNELNHLLQGKQIISGPFSLTMFLMFATEPRTIKYAFMFEKIRENSLFF